MSEELKDENNEEHNQKTFDESYVMELRKEAASYRVRLREEEARREEEVNKFKSKLVDNEFEHLSKELNVVDPQTAKQLLGDVVAFDEEGNINIRTHLENLLEQKPYLKGGSVGRATNPAGGSGNSKLYTKEELGAMSSEQIRADWKNIQEQLATGTLR